MNRTGIFASAQFALMFPPAKSILSSQAFTSLRRNTAKLLDTPGLSPLTKKQFELQSEWFTSDDVAYLEFIMYPTGGRTSRAPTPGSVYVSLWSAMMVRSRPTMYRWLNVDHMLRSTAPFQPRGRGRSRALLLHTGSTAADLLLFLSTLTRATHSGNLPSIPGTLTMNLVRTLLIVVYRRSLINATILDSRIAVESAKFVRKIAQSQPLASYVVSFHEPAGNVTTDDDWLE